MSNSKSRIPLVGDGIIAEPGSWRFDGSVPGEFDQHIIRSIPGYMEGHEYVVNATKSIISTGGVCYELGCSTGTLCKKLALSATTSRSKIIGIDQIQGMIDIARQRCAEFEHVSFEVGDIVDCNFKPASAIVSYYTIHFLPARIRQAVIRKIYDALLPNGIFIMFEKIKFPDPVKHREITDAYYDFKRSMGFTEEEIRAKADSLEGILVPQTEESNLMLLNSAGFGKVNTVFTELCWQGYLAQK